MTLGRAALTVLAGEPAGPRVLEAEDFPLGLTAGAVAHLAGLGLAAVAGVLPRLQLARLVWSYVWLDDQDRPRRHWLITDRGRAALKARGARS